MICHISFIYVACYLLLFIISLFKMSKSCLFGNSDQEQNLSVYSEILR